MKRVTVSFLGLGNVGLNALRIIDSYNRKKAEQEGVFIEVNAVSDSRAAIGGDRLDTGKIIKSKENGNLMETGYRSVDRDWIIESGSEIIVDAMPASRDGGRELELYTAAMNHGKNIVTANKSGLANHWKEIMNTAKASGRSIRYEATVAGGVPLFSMVDFSLSPSEVTGFRGIVSLTVNYFLRRMASGEKFGDILHDAMKLGILEADYHDDTMGIDAARKSVILANSIFKTNYTLKDVRYSGVENLSDEEISRFTKNTRIVTSVERMDGRIVASSVPVNLAEGDFLLKIGEKGLGYQVSTDSNGTVNVMDDYDGPYETAGAVVNDIILSALKTQ